MANLFNTTKAKRLFSGVINPSNEDNKISIFDDWNCDEMQAETKRPKEINNLLFNIMSNEVKNNNSIFNI